MQDKASGKSTAGAVLETMLQVQPGCPEVVRYIMEWRSNATLTKFLEGDREPGCKRGGHETGLKALLARARPFPASQASQSGGVLLRLSADIHQTKSETGRLTTDAPNLQVRTPRPTDLNALFACRANGVEVTCRD